MLVACESLYEDVQRSFRSLIGCFREFFEGSEGFSRKTTTRHLTLLVKTRHMPKRHREPPISDFQASGPTGVWAYSHCLACKCHEFPSGRREHQYSAGAQFSLFQDSQDFARQGDLDRLLGVSECGILICAD